MFFSYINNTEVINRMSFYTMKTIDEQSLDQSKAKDVIWGFRNYTTVHGVPHISKAKGVIKIFLWTVFTLLCVGGLVYNFYSITSRYVAFNVNTVTTLVNSRELTFPAVSVCNYNPVKKSMLTLSPRLQALMAKWTSSGGKTSIQRRRKRATACTSYFNYGSDLYQYCYYGTSRLRYVAAQRSCGTNGGTLAIIDSQAKSDFIFSELTIRLKSTDYNNIKECVCVVEGGCIHFSSSGYFRPRSSGNFWIGLMRVFDRDWTWENGNSLSWSNWDSSSNTYYFNYAYMRISDEEWGTDDGNNGDSDYRKYVMCEYIIEITTTMSTTTTSKATTTTQPKATTVEPTTTIQLQTTTVLPTTTLPATTTLPTATVPTTITTKAMSTVQPTTTVEVKTTVLPTTTTEVTTTVQPSTTVVPTTTIIGETTTTQATTTVELTTTFQPITTIEITTTVPLSTTVVPTMTIEEMTTTEPTTTVELTPTVPSTTTIELSTTVPPTTTIELTNTVPPTTTFALTTTVSPTTTDELTTTVPLTTTVVPTTTIEETTITQPITTVEPTTTPVEVTTSHMTTTSYDATTIGVVATTTVRSVYPDRERYREDFLLETDFIEILADTSEELKNEMGYNLAEFVIGCVYQGKPCDYNKFGYFFDSVHGNCYVFNGGWSENDTSIFTTGSTGSQNGVTFTLNLVQPEYIANTGDAAGALIVIHKQDVMPFPGDQAILAAPGHLLSAGIRQTSSVRLGGQYSNCLEVTGQHYSLNVFEEHFPVNYTVIACEITCTCYQQHVIKYCSCADPQYPVTGEAFGGVTAPICDIRNVTQDDCVYGLTLQYMNNELTCDCPVPCRETAFSHSISYAMWPSEKDLGLDVSHLYYMYYPCCLLYESVAREFKADIDYLKNFNNTYEYINNEDIIRRNFLQVKIFMEDLNYNSIVEKPKYVFFKYISDIGSIIGLWVGCSILTVVEFMELGLDLLVLSFVKVKNFRKFKNKNSNQSSTMSLHSHRSSVISPEYTNILPIKPKHKKRETIAAVPPVQTVTQRKALASISSSSSSSRQNTNNRSTSAAQINVNVLENEADAYVPYYRTRRIARRRSKETTNSRLTQLDDYLFI